MVTTSMKNKKGQECINTAFMTLCKQIDDYCPESTDQNYHTFYYHDKLTSGQKITIDPAPTVAVEVVAITSDNKSVNLGTVGTDGSFTVPTLTFDSISTNTVEWTDSSSSAYCEGTLDPDNVAAVCCKFNCCYTCKDYWPPSFSWNCWDTTTDTVCYTYYKDGCINGYDVNGNPIYNYGCLATCCYTCGVKDTTCGCDETIVYKQTTFESWVANGGGIYDTKCSVERSDLGDYCDCDFYRCLYTSRYICYCCYKSKTGETVCVGLKECPDDVVQIVYYSDPSSSCAKHLRGLNANTVSQCANNICYTFYASLKQHCLTNMDNSVYLCEHETVSPYAAGNWACICQATTTDCGSRSVSRDSFPSSCCLSFEHTVYTNPNNYMLGVNCIDVGQIVKADEDYDKVSQSIPYDWLNYQSYLCTINDNQYYQGGAGYWCYSYDNCSCAKCRCPFDGMYLPPMKKRINTSYCVVIKHHITECLNGCCFTINLVYR